MKHVVFCLLTLFSLVPNGYSEVLAPPEPPPSTLGNAQDEVAKLLETLEKENLLRKGLELWARRLNIALTAADLATLYGDKNIYGSFSTPEKRERARRYYENPPNSFDVGAAIQKLLARTQRQPKPGFIKLDGNVTTQDLYEFEHDQTNGVPTLPSQDPKSFFYPEASNLSQQRRGFLSLEEGNRIFSRPPLQINPTLDEVSTFLKLEFQEVEQILREIEDFQGTRTFGNTVFRLDLVTSRLYELSNRLELMSKVAPDENLKISAGQAKVKVELFLIQMFSNEKLYNAVQAYAKTPEAGTLPAESAKLLQDYLQDFRQNGFETREREKLSPEMRARVSQLKKEMVELGEEFLKNVKASRSTLTFTPGELEGMPESMLSKMERNADGDYVVTFGNSSPFIQQSMAYISDPSVREKIWIAREQLAPENKPILKEVMKKAEEIADILHYPTYADYATESLFAGNHTNVDQMLTEVIRDLQVPRNNALKAMLKLKRDELRKLGRSEEEIRQARIGRGDWAHYERRIAQEFFGFDPEETRQYFALDSVVIRLLQKVGRLFDIQFVMDMDAPRWSQEVQVFRVYDSSKYIGRLYLDLHARPGKTESGGMAYELQGRRTLGNGQFQTAEVAITASFPSFLSMKEILTLSHEVGHTVAYLLKNSRFGRHAASRVPADFREAPSMFIQRWASDPRVLNSLSIHYDDPEREARRRDVLVSMASAYQTTMPVEKSWMILLASVDSYYYSHPADSINTTTVWANLQQQIMGMDFLPGTFPEARISHFANYTVGTQYVYTAGDKLATRLFRPFEADPFDPRQGYKLRRLILEPGGSTDLKRQLGHF